MEDRLFGVTLDEEPFTVEDLLKSAANTRAEIAKEFPNGGYEIIRLESPPGFREREIPGVSRDEMRVIAVFDCKQGRMLCRVDCLVRPLAAQEAT